jgi:hypothetical protein
MFKNVQIKGTLTDRFGNEIVGGGGVGPSKSLSIQVDPSIAITSPPIYKTLSEVSTICLENPNVIYEINLVTDHTVVIGTPLTFNKHSKIKGVHSDFSTLEFFGLGQINELCAIEDCTINFTDTWTEAVSFWINSTTRTYYLNNIKFTGNKTVPIVTLAQSGATWDFCGCDFTVNDGTNSVFLDGCAAVLLLKFRDCKMIESHKYIFKNTHQTLIEMYGCDMTIGAWIQNMQLTGTITHTLPSNCASIGYHDVGQKIPSPAIPNAPSVSDALNVIFGLKLDTPAGGTKNQVITYNGTNWTNLNIPSLQYQYGGPTDWLNPPPGGFTIGNFYLDPALGYFLIHRESYETHEDMGVHFEQMNAGSHIKIYSYADPEHFFIVQITSNLGVVNQVYQFRYSLINSTSTCNLQINDIYRTELSPNQLLLDINNTLQGNAVTTELGIKNHSNDGKQYANVNGAWVEITGGGGVSIDTAFNNPTSDTFVISEKLAYDTYAGKANTSHNHVKADVTDFSHTHDYTTDLTNVPTTFTPSAHNHVKADVTDFSHTHDYTTDLTNVPTTFTPNAHNHAISDVTDFNITAPSNGQLMVYDNTSSKWINNNLVDSSTVFADNVTPTKRMQFELTGLTAGLTRTLTVPNYSGTILTSIDAATYYKNTGNNFGAHATLGLTDYTYNLYVQAGGMLSLKTLGQAGYNPSNKIEIATGIANTTGDIDIKTGTTTNSFYTSGTINLTTGMAKAVGDINLFTADAMPIGTGTGKCGNINLICGNSAASSTVPQPGGMINLAATPGAHGGPDGYISLYGDNNTSYGIRIYKSGIMSSIVTPDYENLVGGDDDIPNRKYVHDKFLYCPKTWGTVTVNAASVNDVELSIDYTLFKIVNTHGSGSHITGFANGSDCRQVTLLYTNASSWTTNLDHDSTSSLEANRIISPTTGSILLNPAASATLVYDSTTTRWYVIHYSN